MEKRELIDKEKFIKNAGKLRVSEFEYDYIIDGLNRAKVSEKDIVKPYLEKLESKLLDCCDPRIRTETEIPIKKVLDFIDSLLTEKGAEE